MCFACEQEQMMAAYREYVARRKELLRARAGESDAPNSESPNSKPSANDTAAGSDDWAKGTWFAAAAGERDE